MKVLFLSKSVAKHQKGFFFTFTSKDKLFFKGTSYLTKNKTKIKIPKVLWDTVVSGYEGNIFFNERKDFVHILLESLLENCYAKFQPEICACNECADRPLSREM